MLWRIKRLNNENAYSIVATFTSITSGVVSRLVALRKLPRKLSHYRVDTQPDWVHYNQTPLLEKRWKITTMHEMSWWQNKGTPEVNNRVAGVVD